MTTAVPRADFDTTPYRAQPQKRANPLAKPGRRRVQGRSAMDSVPSLISQTNVESTAASSWLGIGGARRRCDAWLPQAPGIEDLSRQLRQTAYPGPSSPSPRTKSGPVSLKTWYSQHGCVPKHYAGAPSYMLHLKQPEARHEKLLISRAEMSEEDRRALFERYGAVAKKQAKDVPGRAPDSPQMKRSHQ